MLLKVIIIILPISSIINAINLFITPCTKDRCEWQFVTNNWKFYNESLSIIPPRKNKDSFFYTSQNSLLTLVLNNPMQINLTLSFFYRASIFNESLTWVRVCEQENFEDIQVSNEWKLYEKSLSLNWQQQIFIETFILEDGEIAIEDLIIYENDNYINDEYFNDWNEYNSSNAIIDSLFNKTPNLWKVTKNPSYLPHILPSANYIINLIENKGFNTSTTNTLKLITEHNLCFNFKYAYYRNSIEENINAYLYDKNEEIWSNKDLPLNLWTTNMINLKPDKHMLIFKIESNANQHGFTDIYIQNSSCHLKNTCFYDGENKCYWIQIGNYRNKWLNSYDYNQNFSIKNINDIKHKYYYFTFYEINKANYIQLSELVSPKINVPFCNDMEMIFDVFYVQDCDPETIIEIGYYAYEYTFREKREHTISEIKLFTIQWNKWTTIKKKIHSKNMNTFKYVFFYIRIYFRQKCPLIAVNNININNFYNNNTIFQENILEAKENEKLWLNNESDSSITTNIKSFEDIRSFGPCIFSGNNKCLINIRYKSDVDLVIGFIDESREKIELHSTRLNRLFDIYLKTNNSDGEIKEQNMTIGKMGLIRVYIDANGRNKYSGNIIIYNISYINCDNPMNEVKIVEFEENIKLLLIETFESQETKWDNYKVEDCKGNDCNFERFHRIYPIYDIYNWPNRDHTFLDGNGMLSFLRNTNKHDKPSIGALKSKFKIKNNGYCLLRFYYIYPGLLEKDTIYIFVINDRESIDISPFSDKHINKITYSYQEAVISLPNIKIPSYIVIKIRFNNRNSTSTKYIAIDDISLSGDCQLIF